MPKKIRILILEDVEADADIIQWELKKANISFEALLVTNRAEFEKGLHGFLPDIILSDHSLPHFNSFEALRMVRARDVQVPFILITGTVSEEFAVEIMRSGADDYILKDRMQRLSSSVKNVLEKYRLSNEKLIAIQKVMESDANLHAIINNTNDCIFSVDRNYRLLSFNKVFSETVLTFTGLIIEEGSPFFIKETSDHVLKEWEQYIKKGLEGERFITEATYRYENKDFFYEVAVNPIRKEQEIIGVGCFARDITGKKKAGEKLKESELRFHALMENNYDGITLRDEKLEIIYRNPAAIRMLGYTEEDGNTRSLLDTAHPDDKDIINAAMLAVLHSKGKPVASTFRSRHKDGHYVYLEGVMMNMLHEKSVQAYVTNFRDVTSRKMAEEKLYESERKFRALIENNYDGITLRDKDFSLIYRSPAAIKMMGWGEEESHNNRSLLVSTHPDDLDIVNQAMIDVLQYEGKPVSLTFRVMHKAGHYIWLELSMTNLLHDKSVNAIISNFRDVTERKTSEEALLKSEERYRQIVETAQEGIWTVDENNNTNFVNKKLSHILGYTSEEMLGKPAYNFMGEEAMMIAIASVEKWKQGVKQNYEFRYTTKREEKVWVNISASPILNFEGKYKGTLAMVTDISERKKSETELNELNEQLRNLSAHLQTVREEERTSMAREVHDELGQQMTSLKMDIASLKNKYEKELPDIGIKTETMLEMVNEAIRTVRKIVIALRPGILDDLGLEAAIEWQAKDFEQRTGIECIFKSSLEQEKFSPEINITVFRIFQESLTNIMRHAGATLVTANLYEEHHQLMLGITDNGVGISDERKYNKTSFGLLGMKERAAMIKGDLEIIKLPVMGTQVNLKIPL